MFCGQSSRWLATTAAHLNMRKTHGFNRKSMMPTKKRPAASCCDEPLTIKSGRQDLNLQLPAPKAGALARLSYAPGDRPTVRALFLRQKIEAHELTLVRQLPGILTE